MLTMKANYLLTTLIFVLSLSTNAISQSVTASKILSYLKSQSQIEISKDLVKIGFVFDKKYTEPNLTEYSYNKNGNYGIEKFNISFNDELFMIVYKPANSYSSMKEIMLTNDFVYSYSYKNNKYYVNGSMRIGINDTSGIISFFVKLK